MSRIILPPRCIAQPASGFQLERRFGTVFAATPNSIGGTLTSVTVVADAKGSAYSFAGGLTGASGVSKVDLGDKAIDCLSSVSTQPGWILLVFNPGDSASWDGTNNNAICSKSSGVGNGWSFFHLSTGEIYWDIGASSLANTNSVSASLTSKTWIVLIGTYNGKSTSASWGKIYVNGINKTSASTAGSGTSSDAGVSLLLGTNLDGGSAADSVGKIAFIAIGKGVLLSASQAMELSVNPWQVVKTQPRRYWVPDTSLSFPSPIQRVYQPFLAR